MSSCKRGDKKYVDVWFLFTVDNADNDGRSNFKNYLPTIKRLTNRMNHNGNGDAFSLLRFVENLYTVCGSPSKCGTFLTNRETFTLLALSPLRGRFASSIAATSLHSKNMTQVISLQVNFQDQNDSIFRYCLNQ
jgi:hypothetical protein